MKSNRNFSLIVILVFASIVMSCGPVIISSRPQHPTPSWFYPNRVINVRYVFFPDQMLYYDLSLRNYIFFDSGNWRRVENLPPRYNSLNLRKEKRYRIENYFGDSIKNYHDNNTRGRSKNATRRND
jgi:hypothetical protein